MRSSPSACPSAGMSECLIIRMHRNVAATQAAAGNRASRNLMSTSQVRKRARRREEGLGGETRRSFKDVGPHEDGSAGAIHQDARCATLYEKNDRSEERYTHRTPCRGGAAFWAHRSPGHRHPEGDAEQHDQHHQQDDDGDLHHVDDRITRSLRAPSTGRSCRRRRLHSFSTIGTVQPGGFSSEERTTSLHWGSVSVGGKESTPPGVGLFSGGRPCCRRTSSPS